MKSIQTLKKEILRLNKTTTPIDTDILELIVGIRAFNIPTQGSCAGHRERNGTFPFIDIHKDDSHISYDDYSKKMIRLKTAWIKENIAIQRKLIALLTEFYATRKVDYKYQISLHTMLDLAWVRLKCMGADLLKDMPSKTFKKELLIYQDEMKKFGSFLIKKYRDGVNK